MGLPKKPRNPCPVCQHTVQNIRSRYCSNTCQMEQQYLSYIERWKAGQESGNVGTQVSSYVKKYLRAKYENKCSRCNWSKKNPVTGTVPVTVEHIDGNWRNSKEQNLDLICPCCHSLTPTYGNLNKGRGRPMQLVRGLSSSGKTRRSQR